MGKSYRYDKNDDYGYDRKSFKKLKKQVKQTRETRQAKREVDDKVSEYSDDDIWE